MTNMLSVQDRFDVHSLNTLSFVEKEPGRFIEIDAIGVTPVISDVIKVKIHSLDLDNPTIEIDPDPTTASPFDLDGSLVNRDPGEAVQIKVEMLDPHYSFLRHATYITAADDASALVLRRGTVDHKKMDFFVIRSALVSNVYFNIGFRSQSGIVFFVDPKLENNG